MTITKTGFWWEPPSTLTAIFRRKTILHDFEGYLSRELRWGPAKTEDWPPAELVTGDFVPALEGGLGWVAEVDGKRLFLVPRGFEEPEWSLADYGDSGQHWRRLGEFQPLPTNWSVPPLTDHA